MTLTNPDRFADRWSRGIVVDRPGRIAPALVTWSRRVLRPLMRLAHRPRLTGTEHLPPEGPFLLVANHSAGTGIAEILSFLALYLEQVGPERRLAGFALPVGFHVFPFSRALRGIGAIPASYEAAEETLAAGVPILVFPGGDHEALRPLWQANRVDFGGRVGFLRIAHQANVPVVPMGIRGSHFTAPILWRSRALATCLVLPRLLGVKRWGLSALGLIVATLILALFSGPLWLGALLVWLWLGTPLVLLPWIPWTIRLRIGRAIPASELFPDGQTASREDRFQAALKKVEAAVQSLVD